MDNTNQKSGIEQSPAQNLDSHPVRNQKGNLLLILGVILLVIIVSAGAYFLGLSKSKTTNETQNNAAQVTPSNNQTGNVINSSKKLASY